VRTPLQRRLDDLVTDFAERILRLIAEGLHEVRPVVVPPKVKPVGSSGRPRPASEPKPRSARRPPHEREPRRAPERSSRMEPKRAQESKRPKEPKSEQALEDALLRVVRDLGFVPADGVAGMIGASSRQTSIVDRLVDHLVAEGRLGVTGDGDGRMLFESRGAKPAAAERAKPAAAERAKPAAAERAKTKAPAAASSAPRERSVPPAVAEPAPASTDRPSAVQPEAGRHPFVIRRKKAAGT
jgi:hypothetical protein